MSDSDESVSSSSASTSSSVDERPAVDEEEPSNKKRKVVSETPLEIVASPSGGPVRKDKPIIILLDQATIESVKNKKNVYELLNCDDHRDYCKKKLRKDPNEFRPDILHQEMLALLDSPLNKAGMVRLYIQTKKRVLIEVNPSLRMPRTYKRFAGLMVQLLHKMKIKSSTESTTLLKVIKNPFSQHLPAGTRCYGFSSQGDLCSPIALAKNLLPPSPDDDAPPTCFIVGAMSTGHVTLEDHPYMEKMLSISEYPLSGAAALSRIMGGIEHYWGVV